MLAKGIAVFVVLGMAFVPSAAQSEGTLWDIIVQASLESETIERGQTPVVAGQVTDHAGKPVRDADIKVTSGDMSFITKTDQDGGFGQELAGFDGLPGEYIVSIKAKLGDQVGFQTLQFRVQGDVRESEVLWRQIETAAAQKYIGSDAEDYANNPLGMKLYEYYQGIYMQYLDALAAEAEEDEKQKILDEQREAAAELLEKSIEEKNPGAGVYEGWSYDRFVDNLDLSIRDAIVSQLNHTTNSLYEAQRIMESILEEGGTYEDARQAYLERLSMTKEMMNEMISDDGPDVVTNSTSIGAKDIVQVKDYIVIRHT